MRLSKFYIFFILFGFFLFALTCSTVNFFSNKVIDDFGIKIKEVKLKELSLKNIEFEVIILLENYSKKKYTVNKLNVDIYKSENYDEILGSSSIKNSFIILPKNSSEYISYINFSTLKLGTTLLKKSIKKNHSFYISINAEVKYKKINIPINIKKKVDYNPNTSQIELK